MANKKNSTRVCDSIIAQVFLLAIGSRIQHDIHPQGGWSRTNRYYKTVTPCILLIPPLVDDKNHGFCAKHHMLLLNLVLDTYCNCTICCIPEFKRWPMQSVIAFFSLSWKTLVWTVLPPLAPSSSRMIVNGDGTIITMLWHSFEEICYLQLRGGTRRRRERERERERERDTITVVIMLLLFSQPTHVWETWWSHVLFWDVKPRVQPDLQVQNPRIGRQEHMCNPPTRNGVQDLVMWLSTMGQSFHHHHGRGCVRCRWLDMHQTTPWALFHIEESGLLQNPIPTLCASCCPHCQVQTPATKQPRIITMCASTQRSPWFRTYNPIPWIPSPT